MFFEAERWEVDAVTENLGLCQNTHSTNAIDLHFHVGIAIGVPEICKMGTPGSIFCVSLHDNCIFVESIRECEGGFGLGPGVKVVGLFSAQPVR